MVDLDKVVSCRVVSQYSDENVDRNLESVNLSL